jgi:hypothetical protein
MLPTPPKLKPLIYYITGKELNKTYYLIISRTHTFNPGVPNIQWEEQ